MIDYCKNCSEKIIGKYCHNCGQRKFDKSQKNIRHLIHDGFHFITHLEGNIFQTLKAVLTKPGKLSLDYSNGMQKKYFKPVSLYLLIVIIYLLFPLLQGMNIDLSSHRTMFAYGSYASKKIDLKMKKENYTEDELRALYKPISVKVSKVLLMTLIPISVAFLLLIFYSSKKMTYDHWLISVEFNSYYLAFTYILFPLVVFPLTSFNIFRFLNTDAFYTIASSTWIIVYSTFLFRKCYSQKWFWAISKAFFFVVLHIFVGQTLLRFLQFQISFTFL